MKTEDVEVSRASDGSSGYTGWRIEECGGRGKYSVVVSLAHDPANVHNQLAILVEEQEFFEKADAFNSTYHSQFPDPFDGCKWLAMDDAPPWMIEQIIKVYHMLGIAVNEVSRASDGSSDLPREEVTPPWLRFGEPLYRRIVLYPGTPDERIIYQERLFWKEPAKSDEDDALMAR